ncbi:MAG: hypothetical protein A2413_17850 [Treponema sp. RIFOXYC1_FULL_61_9]|nr:MAG: hypothetical protein A2413_17850 [Treponema sp. RIFOXYC1_FULL_61_9]
MIRRIATILTSVLALALWMACSDGTVAVPGPPGPGEIGYVPQGWVAPSLLLEAAAYLPARVTEFVQAPGVHARNSSFRIESNEEKLLDWPEGGGVYAPENGSLVSLGMAGGYVVLEFDPPLENYPGATDFIVFGNAYFQGGASDRVWQEPGTVWVREDEDSEWLLLAPAVLVDGGWESLASASSELQTVSYTKGSNDPDWWPMEEDSSTMDFPGVFMLPDSIYGQGVSSPVLRGLADTAPTLIRGDLSGTGALNDSGRDDDGIDGEDDYPGIDPAWFYTVPDAPGDRDIRKLSGGGAAMDLDWALSPSAAFAPAPPVRVKFVKIVSGTKLLNGAVGDYSCEVDAVVRAVHP